MRNVVLTAVVLLLAGCGQSGGGDAEQSATTSATDATRTTAPNPTTSTVPTSAPVADADMPAVVHWVEAGTAAAPDGFHTATRDGVSTQLGGRIAFVTPAGIQCMSTDDNADALACLVTLTDPPKQPADSYGHWVGGWVDFDGLSAQIGSAHADPGGFNDGTGARLDPGSSLRFGDYQCRSDTTALVCINYAHQSGLRLAATGVTPFGCLRPDTADQGGIRFAC